MGYWEGAWVVPGIALPDTTRPPTTPGTPSPPSTADTVPATADAQRNIAVGLESVDQLSLVAHFSGFHGITEVYNLVKAGKSNDHKCIPGTD